jgi:hypothetical protein
MREEKSLDRPRYSGKSAQGKLTVFNGSRISMCVVETRSHEEF